MKYILVFLIGFLCISTTYGQVASTQDSLYFRIYHSIVKDVYKRHNKFHYYDVALASIEQTMFSSFYQFREDYTFIFDEAFEKKLFYFLQDYYYYIDIKPEICRTKFYFGGGEGYVFARINSREKRKPRFILLGLGNIFKKGEKDFYLLVTIGKKFNDEYGQIKGLRYYQHIQIEADGSFQLKERIYVKSFRHPDIFGE